MSRMLVDPAKRPAGEQTASGSVFFRPGGFALADALERQQVSDPGSMQDCPLPHRYAESAMHRLLLVCLCLAGLSPVQAAPISCPELASAVQVGTCPTEEELRYTYTGYCSDNARMYEKTDSPCANFESYRTLKNTALWESADGEFSAYLNCATAATQIRAARPSALALVRQGNITQVVCRYGESVTFTHRTRATCRAEDAARCSSDASACTASCD
jgi:hypothetical protein